MILRTIICTDGLGKRIRRVSDISVAALMRRSVVIPSSMIWCRPKPASFILSMPARRVLLMIEEGMYVYNTPKKERRYYDYRRLHGKKS